MDSRIRRVMNLMHQSLGDQLSIRFLSKSVNLSSERLRQLFKKETGLSPMQHLKELRMQHAEQLLQGTFLSIKEVAFRCGAKDFSHFVRDFKRRKGVTPSAFRARFEPSLETRTEAVKGCE